MKKILKSITKFIGIGVIFIGCTKKKIVTEEVNAWIWGVISFYSSGSEVQFHSENPIDTSLTECEIFWPGNSKKMDKKEIYLGYVKLEFSDDFEFPTHMFYTVKIKWESGEYSVKLPMPGSIDSIIPKMKDTLYFQDKIITEWSKSPLADFYLVSIHISSIDSGIWFYKRINLTLPDTFLDIAPYFKGSQAKRHDIWLLVWPYTGALEQPNIHGDINGYIFMEGDGISTHFYVFKDTTKKFIFSMEE